MVNVNKTKTQHNVLVMLRQRSLKGYGLVYKININEFNMLRTVCTSEELNAETSTVDKKYCDVIFF